MPMDHVMDVDPDRFGWRYWRLDHTKTRLLSPIHRGPLQGGRSFVEAECEHRPTRSRFTLGADCGHGIYYYPRRSTGHLVGVCNDSFWADASHLAVTFGCAAGSAYPDPVIPHVAMKTSRFRILAMVLPEPSTTAQQLEDNYGVRVRAAQPIDRKTITTVEADVRALLHDAEPDRYFKQLQQEPTQRTDPAQVCDIDEFGWRMSLLTRTGRMIAPQMRDATTAAPQFQPCPPLVDRSDSTGVYITTHCSHATQGLSLTCDCGIHYAIAYKYMLTYLRMFMDATWNTSYTNDYYALTFGRAHGTLPDSNSPDSFRRAARFYPLHTLLLRDAVPPNAYAIRDRYRTPITVVGEYESLPIEMRRAENTVRARSTKG